MDDKFNSTILVAPLDWGLGHATRCIPIIRHLLDIGCNVLIAAEGAQKKLLQIEFPLCEFITLKGYRVNYSRNKRLLPVKIALQLPKILKAISLERKWLDSITKKHHIHAIISDNRYGLWHRKIPSAIIIHQLSIDTPGFMRRWVQKLHYRFINMFSVCWIPDVEKDSGIAGKLSHPDILPGIPAVYIGGLSRFYKLRNKNKRYDILVVLSGPEPQRTILEQKMLQDVTKSGKKVLFVRGLPDTEKVLQSTHHTVIVNHLPAHELNIAFEESELIISRSGYTTVMDILKLQKRSVLVPTPGQTEQEYLAHYLKERRWCLSFPQNEFSIREALAKAETFPYVSPNFAMDEYKAVIEKFVISGGSGPV